jgi:quercetin dioxygenase-like cupin family protein
MPDAGSSDPLSAESLARRIVHYADLRPCTTAFIDTRTPGSAEKENFTIIGPGVAENPDQHVHISIPHGFNIGGARQPPGCVNSQHSHETAEVFIIHSGRWAFYLGPNREDGEVVLGPGDVISIPVNVFRGFANVGDDTGFMFAVLGGDDPGHVTWAPYVFDDAMKYGMILLEDGNLVDTTVGESIPEGKRAMRPTSAEDVGRSRRMTSDELGACILTGGDLLRTHGGQELGAGVSERPIIGKESTTEGLSAGKMSWPHGFHLRQITLEPGTISNCHSRSEEEVLLIHKGKLVTDVSGQKFVLAPGDTFTIPINAPRIFSNNTPESVEIYVVRGGDDPQSATNISEPS